MGRIGIILILISSMAINYSYAQRLSGKIMGMITDEEGNILPGVKAELSSPALLGGTLTQVSSEKGTYRFVNLPPGICKIVFSLEGFQKVERLNLKVIVGATITENIVLKQTKLEKSIIVTAEAPVIDVTKSGVSTNFGIDELEKIPSGKDSFFDVIKQAPGFLMTGPDNLYSVVFGSNTEANIYQVDGVDITNPEFGAAYMFMPASIFEEIEVLTLGSPAEYGQFSGAVVNIVTKSGGNTFGGSISYYGQFDALTSDNNPKPGETFSYHRNELYYLSFNLGGPIIKDKVWFFANYEKSQDSASYWNSNPDYPSNFPADKAFIKLSSQIATGHRLVSSFYYETYKIPEPVASPYNTPDVLGNIDSHTPTWNLLYTWMISKNSYFDFKYAGHWSGMELMPIHSTLSDAPHYDGYTGISSGGMSWMYKYEVGRNQVNANLSYFAEDFFAGDHDFKIGVQYNRGKCSNIVGYSGNEFYYDYAGEPTYMYYQNKFYYGGVINSIGAFLDDSWRIGDRATVNLGFRFDHSKGSIPSFPVMDGWTKTREKTQSIDDVVTWNNFSPRIGFALQLTSDKKTLLRASYGRYYEGLQIGTWEGPGPNVTDWYKYIWNENTTSWTLAYVTPGEMGYSIDPNQKAPYSDQITLGLERELLADFSIGATFIYKKMKDLVCWEDRGATYEQISMVSPDNGQSYTVWNQTSPLGSNDYWITNPPGFEQTYWGALFSLNKRYSKNWMMHASLNWSKSEGLVPGSTWEMQNSILIYTQYGKDPNDLINAKGSLQNDRRWVFKAQMGYSFPWSILASVNYFYQTGRPFPIYVRIYPDQGVRNLFAEPRSQRNKFESESILDFRLQKTFNIYNTLKIHAIFDVFNVFNSNTVTSYGSYRLWSQSYQQNRAIFWPRRIQVGLLLEF